MIPTVMSTRANDDPPSIGAMLCLSIVDAAIQVARVSDAQTAKKSLAEGHIYNANGGGGGRNDGTVSPARTRTAD